MRLKIEVGIPDDLPTTEAEQLKQVPHERLTEVLVSGLYANGLITSKAGMAFLEQTRREFYEMLARNHVPLSSPETDEDIEENRALYQRGQ